MVLVADKDKLKNLKAKCKELEHTVSRLTEQLAMNDAAKKLELSNMELQTKLDSQKLIDAAYEKGFTRCKENMKELKSLQM